MSGGRGGRKTLKELTVFVDVGDNKSVSAGAVIKSVEEAVGEGTVAACVPKSGNGYEITLLDYDALELICDTGFKIKNNTFKPNAIFSKEKLVSFLNVSYYVTDEEITKKLTDAGLELVTSLKRRMYPGTSVADGTRFAVVKFPGEIQSLPYSMKFSTGINSFEYIRVVHDNQKKVCTKCYESGHVYANCPENRCFKCYRTGHLAKMCNTPPCKTCNKYPHKCNCTPWGEHSRPEAEIDEAELWQTKGGDTTSDDNTEEATLMTANDDTVDTGSGDVQDDDDTLDIEDISDIETDNCVNLKNIMKEPVSNMDTDSVGNIDTCNKFGGSGFLGHQGTASDSGIPLFTTDFACKSDDKDQNDSESVLELEKDKSDEDCENLKKICKMGSGHIRRRKMVTGPSLTAEDIKKLKQNPRHKLSC